MCTNLKIKLTLNCIGDSIKYIDFIGASTKKDVLIKKFLLIMEV